TRSGSAGADEWHASVSSPPLKPGGGRGPAIAIERHAISGRHREPCALDLARAGAMLQLQHRFRDSIQSASGASRLAGAEHPAPGIEGKPSLADVAAREARK